MRNEIEARTMADLASSPSDLDIDTSDAATPDPTLAAPDTGDGNLLGELARAMHAAATSQAERLNAELERRRAEQVEAIAARASAETESLKADTETDIGAIDAWAKSETEKIKLERLRRIDARREQLAGQLEREETIKEREIFAIEVAIDAHRNDMQLFFGRLERETDPSAIARVAATMPAFPSLDDVAEQARRSAAGEFAAIEGQRTAEATTATAGETASTVDATASNEGLEPDADMATPADAEPAAAVSETRLKAVMDPVATRDEGSNARPWEAPHVVSVAAGSGAAAEEPAPVSVGSTLLRTVRSIRPMARHDKDSGEGHAAG